ncbi:cytochrome c biogenesis CcdA family protein [Catenulispora rubra]|uniref:cytochrome c biogenesis CcdA family protein n=1 Tax=Catenulispora rubra TaxID=280293 RepID=UPI0018922EFA|nr:cytochrome c biogenesis CcdA family protein [Catenulispora rubra]
MGNLLFGTTLLASFFGGVVALLAPCCVSVMLPAYLATGFRTRGRVVAATLAFTGGLATVIVPIGLGAAAVSAMISRDHFTVYLVMGAVMFAMGAAMLFGIKVKLPMISGGPGRSGFGAAYLLGAFSGVASACCAPVLAGVVVLAGASGSFPAALTVGLVYVLGMVAPLLVIALAWERGNRRWAKVLQGRSITVPGTSRRLPIGELLAGILLMAIGVITVVIAATGPDMPTTGWRITLSADLQHWAAVTTRHLSFVPGWVVAAVGAAAVALLLRRALRTVHSDPDDDAAKAEVISNDCCATGTSATTTTPVLMMETTDGR